jgi:hypothetical protein
MAFNCSLGSEVSLRNKLFAVEIGLLALTLDINDLFVRCINPIRALFGMKPRTS